MVGIASYGAYIPWHRLDRAGIAKAWGIAGPVGEKAVANYDEDTITMATAAAIDCLGGTDRQKIDALYFATTTAPYKEKQSAATIAAALDLRRDVLTIDFSNSLRAGTSAIRAAIDTIISGSGKNVLVCAAEMRLGLPKGEMEMSFGDGAAALLIGDKNLAASIDGSYSIFNEIVDVWRPGNDRFVRSWEDRFVRNEGYSKILTEGVILALKKFDLTIKDIAKAVLYAPDSRALSVVAGALGLDLKNQVQDCLYNTVGNTGTALSIMMLVGALEEANAGDKILLASYGDGSDVHLLNVTENIENFRDRRGIKWHLASKQMLPVYGKYVLWRELMSVQPPSRPPLEQPSPAALLRDIKGIALCGSKCKHCGTPQYPAQRVCMECHAKDEMEDYDFSGKIGSVFSFSHDNLVASVDSPVTATVVDFPGGGRIICDMTDRVPEEVEVGMPVEMTFRKLHYVGGIYNYWWKCRPARQSATISGGSKNGKH